MNHIHLWIYFSAAGFLFGGALGFFRGWTYGRGRIRNAITENADRFSALSARLRVPTIVEFCWKCDVPRECRIVSHRSGTETLCNVCDAQVDFDIDDEEDDGFEDEDDQDWDDWEDEYDDDQWDEPIGSCESCGTNLYSEDDDDLCDQCLWRITGGEGRCE